jgi:hypothetical protein
VLKEYLDFDSEIWKAVMLVLLTERIYEVRRWNWLRWHDIRAEFHSGQLWHLSDITALTSTIWETVIFVLLMEGIYELGR